MTQPEPINFYSHLPKKYVGQKHTYANYNAIRIDLPFRMIIVGASGSMKTNTLLNIVTQMNAFTRLYLFARNLDEPLYRYLRDCYQNIEKKMGIRVYTESNLLDDLPEVDDYDSKESNLVVFDDMITERDTSLKKVSELFIRGRKHNVSTIFISQSYYKIPKLIRSNVGYIILKAITSGRDLKMILKETALDVNEGTLSRIYRYATHGSLQNWLMIDLNTNDPHLKYRRNFSPIK